MRIASMTDEDRQLIRDLDREYPGRTPAVLAEIFRGRTGRSVHFQTVKGVLGTWTWQRHEKEEPCST